MIMLQTTIATQKKTDVLRQSGHLQEQYTVLAAAGG